MRETVRTIPNVSPEMTPMVRVSHFAESHLQYEVLYWVRDYMLAPEIDAKIRERVWYIFRRHAVPTPFPVRHVLFEPRESAAAPPGPDYSALIAAVDIFAHLASDERHIIVQALVRYVYGPGETILRRGEAGESMFVIARGQVEVRFPALNNVLQQIAVLGPGDVFGEMALFTGEPRSADVVALEEVEILEIGKTSMQALLEHNARLAEAFGEKIAERQQSRVTQVSRYSPENPEEHPETILHRIKRFFNLV